MVRAANPIDVIEAAYDLDLPPRAWLERVANALKPLLDAGFGVFAYYYDASTDPRRWLDDALLLGTPKELIDEAQRAGDAVHATMGKVHSHPEPLEGFLQAVKKTGVVYTSEHLAEIFRYRGVNDYLALRTIEPEGRGITISGPQRREVSVERRSQRLWARVAAHLASARRVRDALASHQVEAVLTPDSRVEHAEGAAATATARAALRDAVARQERARGRLRRKDPVEATEIWTALVNGRWSLLDRFERDGRRYIVARRNDHTLPDPRALTPRERTVVACAMLGKPLKLIAYELGLGQSTVSTHLSSAMRKLGASSRVELLRFATQLGAG